MSGESMLTLLTNACVRRSLQPGVLELPLFPSVADLDMRRRLRSEESFLGSLGVSHQLVCSLCSFLWRLSKSFGLSHLCKLKEISSRFSFGVSRILSKLTDSWLLLPCPKLLRGVCKATFPLLLLSPLGVCKSVRVLEQWSFWRCKSFNRPVVSMFQIPWTPRRFTCYGIKAHKN